MQYSIPLGPGKYIFSQVKDEDGNPVSGGSGEVQWYASSAYTPIGGPVAVTWNAALARYESVIADSSVMPRALGDLWRGEVLIDATTPTAKRYRDSFRARVRAPSSGV